MMEVQNTIPVQSDDGISLLDLALVLAENLRLLIIVPLTAGLIALGMGFLTIPTYTATVRILPPQQQQSTSAVLAAQLGALSGLAGGLAGIKTPGDLYLGFLRSRTVLDAMIERFKLKELYGVGLTEDARRALEGAMKASAGAKDGIITIEVDDRDPKRAAEMANAFVEELRRLTNTIAVTEAAQRRLFFETQLKQSKDNLTKSEIVLRGSAVSEATLKTVPQSTLEVIARLRAQITAQEIKLASMRTYMTDSNADLRVALEELGALRNELSKAEQSNTAKAAGEGAEYVARYRDFKYHETLFELMAKQYELARLDEARQGTVIQVVDAAQIPERKSKPKKAATAVLTTLATFVVTVLFVLTRHAFRNLAKEDGVAEKLGRLRQLLRLRR
jgi:tyrosine-protein kinase Etk/Wzc